MKIATLLILAVCCARQASPSPQPQFRRVLRFLRPMIDSITRFEYFAASGPDDTCEEPAVIDGREEDEVEVTEVDQDIQRLASFRGGMSLESLIFMVSNINVCDEVSM